MRKPRRGWAPKEDDQGKPAGFHQALKDGLQNGSSGDVDAITAAVVVAATEYQQRPKHNDLCPELSSKILRLIYIRKVAISAVERRDVSKKLQKLLKDRRCREREQRLQMILEQGRGQNDLARVLCKPIQRTRVAAMKGADGNRHTSRNGIAEVFAPFYERLYDATSFCKVPNCNNEGAPRTYDDNGTCKKIQKLKPGKTCADDGLFAEMLKTGYEPLLEAIAHAFTDILRSDQSIPKSWCISKLVVLFKKGDVEEAKHYRPIAVIPVLNKLFCMILLSRIKVKLNELQPPEQAGFQPDYSCGDTIQCLRLVAERNAMNGA